MTIICRECSKPFEIEKKRGRPPVKCEECKEKKIGVENIASVTIINDVNITKIDKTTEGLCGPLAKVISLAEGMSKKAGLYEVRATNGVGFLYQGESENEAKKTYDKYVEKSKSGFGQIGHEQVTMTKLGQIVHHFDYYIFIEEYEK